MTRLTAERALAAQLARHPKPWDGHSRSRVRKLLLACGALASLVYVGTDVLAALLYPEYHSFTSRAISELMARSAPTERLVDPLFLFYDVLMMGFAVGVWGSGRARRVRVAAALLFAVGSIGLLGPTFFEMNVRGSRADATSDILHIALTGVLGLVILASVAVSASIRGRCFRLYSFATLLGMVIFGVLTSLAAPELGSAASTPWIGLLERVDIGLFLLWVAVLAASLLRAQQPEP